VSRVRVHAFSVSLDGYGAGPEQSVEHPIGRGGRQLHRWMFDTATFARTVGGGGQGTGLDDEVVRRGQARLGATIMGRNMFGPGRGAWDHDWRGWWGDDPPFHHPVFVLTHHPRAPLTMDGGTTFHFVTGGIEEAVERASVAAGDLDVRVGGGVATVRQFLRAGLLAELDVAIVPVLLGRGERLFDDLDVVAAGYEVTSWTASSAVVHVRITRPATSDAEDA
jgi:dihydrofolate reductase